MSYSIIKYSVSLSYGTYFTLFCIKPREKLQKKTSLLFAKSQAQECLCPSNSVHRHCPRHDHRWTRPQARWSHATVVLTDGRCLTVAQQAPQFCLGAESLLQVALAPAVRGWAETEPGTHGRLILSSQYFVSPWYSNC